MKIEYVKKGDLNGIGEPLTEESARIINALTMDRFNSAVECANEFIETYLQPHQLDWGDVKYYHYYKSMMKNVYPHKEWYEIVSQHIRNMPYADFLQTKYWKAICQQVKFKYGSTCAMCHSKENLNVHHRTYKNHGKEHVCLNDMICLCKKCHSNFHQVS